MMNLSSDDVGVLKEWLREGNGRWADAEQDEEEPWDTEAEHWQMDCDEDGADCPETECRKQASQSRENEAWTRRGRAAELRAARTGNGVWQPDGNHGQRQASPQNLRSQRADTPAPQRTTEPLPESAKTATETRRPAGATTQGGTSQIRGPTLRQEYTKQQSLKKC